MRRRLSSEITDSMRCLVLTRTKTRCSAAKYIYIDILFIYSTYYIFVGSIISGAGGVEELGADSLSLSAIQLIEVGKRGVYGPAQGV